MQKFCGFFLLWLFSLSARADDLILSLYLGRYTDDSLNEEILVNKSIEFEPSNIAALALAKVYSRPAYDRQWELEGQVVKHYRAQKHWEFNALTIHRWQDFPWDHYLKTSFALGIGASYATRVPPLELASHTNEGAAKALLYLMMETSFRPLPNSNLELMVRIHHRSGAKKLINDVAGGSNQICVGIKWHF